MVASQNAEAPDQEAQDASQSTPPWRIALQSFATQWFLIPQGTGIIAVILHQLHYQFYGLVRISQVFWVLTIVLLLSFLLIYLLRWILYPKQVMHALTTDIMEVSCVSSIVITYTTIIQMIALNLTRDWGQGWGTAAMVLWWINAAMAVIACIIIPYIFTRMEAPTIDWVPPGMLLPLIAALTAAAGGGVVCRYAELGAGLQVPIIIVSYLFIGLGLPLSVVVDAIFLARLLDRAFPMKQKVYSLMILCGPLGQGSFALQILGVCVQRGAFREYDSGMFIDGSGGSTVAISSQFIGLITWGYGLFWWTFACIAILHFLISDPKQLLKWDQTLAVWSMVFPMGVFTNGAVELGVVLHSRAFNIWSTILTVLLVIIWLANAAGTVVGVFKGKLLNLDRGWRAKYFEKKEAEAEADHANGDSHPYRDQVPASANSYAGLTSGLRHRE